MKESFYVGTYTDKDAKGIYRFSYEDGKMYDPELFCTIGDPKYLCVFGDLLASLCTVDGKGAVALIDRSGRIVAEKVIEEKGSCYIAGKGNRIYTANYHLGTFSLLEYDNGELKHLNTILIKDKGGCHQILFHEDTIMVPCLFLDRIMCYDFDLKEKGWISFPEGSGPRHGVFDRAHRFLYVLSELSNELFKIDLSKGKIVASTGVLKDGKTHQKGSAALRMSKDEKYLYASTRFENVISVIDANRMELLQCIDCGGDHPRDFVLEDDHLICADRFSNEVVCFRLEDGLVGDITSRIAVPDGVAIQKW